VLLPPAAAAAVAAAAASSWLLMLLVLLVVGLVRLQVCVVWRRPCVSTRVSCCGTELLLLLLLGGVGERGAWSVSPC
jgi:hypothetical protein